MTGFTAEEALEFRGTEDAELVNWVTVQAICDDHGTDPNDFMTETFTITPASPKPTMVDAGDLLAWLGY